MSKSISVIIPNYNGRGLLQKNLPLLIKALHRENISYEIIVPDDASKDDSVAILKEKHPEVLINRKRIKVLLSMPIKGFLPPAGILSLF
jgi:glycosyltransferase involved in cell wall biosynthesis